MCAYRHTSLNLSHFFRLYLRRWWQRFHTFFLLYFFFFEWFKKLRIKVRHFFRQRGEREPTLTEPIHLRMETAKRTLQLSLHSLQLGIPDPVLFIPETILFVPFFLELDKGGMHRVLTGSQMLFKVGSTLERDDRLTYIASSFVLPVLLEDIKGAFRVGSKKLSDILSCHFWILIVNLY